MSKIDDYRILSDIDHILLRPSTYIGSVDLNEMSEYVFDRKENKFDLKKISYVPGLRKIIDEPIDNAVDEYIRSKHQFANKIKVSISDTEVSISDNGRGIPVEKMPGTDGLYIPEAMFTLTKAGSNFNDDGRDTMGMNGLGVKLSNIWSTQFEVVTSDGKNQIRVKASDNNRKHNVKVTPSTKHGTTVTFSPDLARFKIKKIGKEYQDVVYSRLVFLSFLNPGIAFYFNGEKVPVCKDKAFISYFMSDFEMLSNERMTIAVGPAEDFAFLSYVNGLFLSKGGTHVDFIANEVVQGIKSKLEKKHKGIKPADVKNKLFVLAFLNDFPDIRFNSQTKDQLSNATGDVKRYFEGVDLEKFCAQVAKNKSITFSVEENYKIKEEFALRKQLGSSEKAADRKKIEKYLPSIKNNKYLVLTEGDCLDGKTEVMTVSEDHELVSRPLESIKPGDQVLTHNHRLKTVENISSSMRKAVTVKTKSGKEVTGSSSHRVFVYNVSTKRFSFKSLGELDKRTDKLVSSKASGIDMLDKVVGISKIDGEYGYRVTFESGELLSTASHRYLVYDGLTRSFSMKDTTDLSTGDCVCLIEV